MVIPLAFMPVTRHHPDRLTTTDEETLLHKLDDAIRSNLQSQATAVTARYGQPGFSAECHFSVLLHYAVSEDGALHAEKSFQTVRDDFYATRVSLRWQHLIALSRV